MSSLRPVYRRVFLSAVALSFALGLAGHALSASAAPPLDPEGSETEQVVAQRPVEESQGEFLDFLSAAFDAFPQKIVDHSWNSDHGSIMVLPVAEKEALALAANFDVPITVTISSPDAEPFTERSVVEMAVLRKAGLVGSLVSARYEPSNNLVTITVWKQSELAAVRDRVRGNPALKDVAVELSDTADPPTADSSHGGESYSGCTGAFMGNKGTDYGIFTAGHCTTRPSTYNGSATSTSYLATGNHDIRFTVLTGSSAINKFRYNTAGSLNSVTATGIVTAGMNIYKYGQSTGNGSATIDTYAGCVTYTDGKIWCDLYKTTAKVTSPGDSGGPWYVSNTAYGIHSGSNSSASFLTPIA